MKGRKPFGSKIRLGFASVMAVLGLGVVSGGVELLPKDPGTDTQNLTTFRQGTADVYGYNISPSDQLWKATLGMKSAQGISEAAYDAARTGDSWRTKVLLEKGLDVSNPDTQGAFATAALYGRADVVAAYLAARMDPGAKDGAALVAAIEGQNFDIARTLLDLGVSGASGNHQGLFSAAGQGNAEMVDLLLRKGALASAADSMALQQAALNGHADVVALLLGSGANAAANDHAAVKHAAKRGDLEMLKLLVAAGGDVSAGNGYALIWAATNGHADVVEFTLAQQKTYATYPAFPIFGPRAFNFFAMEGDYGATTITAPAVSPNVQDGMALIMAAGAGHQAVVEALVKGGANVNVQDGKALANAVSVGNVEIAKLLLEKGAQVNAGNGEALYNAVLSDNAEMTKLLMNHGADPNLRDGEIKALAERAASQEVRDALNKTLTITYPYMMPGFFIP